MPARDPETSAAVFFGKELQRARVAAGCYRPRYLNIQWLNFLWRIRRSSVGIAGNLVA
jgi:hypothetical protein